MTDYFDQQIVARVQRGDVRVPAYPPSAGKLQRVLGQPGYTISDVVGVLRTDDVLAATTLRLANSAYYARGSAASTLSTAVVRIGSQQLHRLTMAAGTGRVFASSGPLAGLRRRAWRQSLISAVVCERLAEAAGEPAEESFVAGLLHDIGRVLAIAVIEELGGTNEDDMWPVVERFHVELGMVIAAKWMLPPALEEVIADHHVRDAGPNDVILRRVQAADQVVALLEAEPTASAERLGTIGVLTPRECALLAKTIPGMPEFIEAFGINQIPDRAPAPAKTVAPPRATRPVQLKATGPDPIGGELVNGSATSLTVRASTAGRPNWLVQVTVDQLTFWANVTGSQPDPAGGFEWLLKPFALAADAAARWGEITAQLPKAA
ncbi:MAG: HDOD domain-containing protein [Myxococcaceae bacterium]|nr:HDOD domain-containing protein [Myxococcaceae bacterium]